MGTRQVWRHTFLLVLLFSFQLVTSQEYYNQCVAQNMEFDMNDFYDSPADVNIPACPNASGNSCCKASYGQQIANSADPFSQSFLAIVPEPSQECREKLTDISCLMCETAQADWIYVNPGQFSTLVMCESFCLELYDTCSGDMTTEGDVVGEEYVDSSDFCLDLFTDISNSDNSVKLLIDHHNRACWNDLPECTLDSYYKLYSECVNGRRNAIWIKKPEVECSGGIEIPARESNLPCAVSCEEGQKLDGSGDCVECSAGHYSLGGAIRESTWQSWDDLAFHFRTYCTRLDVYGAEHTLTDVDCGWLLAFGMVASPPSLNDTMSAYLETSFTLMEAGTLSFTARVDSERYFDGLNVLVDGEDSPLGLISHEPDFNEYSIDLAAGYHFVQFDYSKDFSISVGLDQAVISAIQVTHINYASQECLPCEPGTYSNARGSSECTLCPANTAAPTAGATECTPCEDNQFSYEGSAQCEDRPPCTEDDYYYRYSQCFVDEDSGELKRRWYATWTEPRTCDITAELPEETLVDCAFCEPGSFREEGSPTCHFCASGYYSEGDGAECVQCDAGKEAIPTLTFDEFGGGFEHGLSTFCENDCATDGWVLHSDFVDSGVGHGTSALSVLRLQQTFATNGTIAFRFSLECEQTCMLAFSSDTSLSYRAYGGPYVFFPQTEVLVSFDVPQGDHVFTWTFTRDDPDNLSRNDRAEIDWIQLRHSAVGGAVDCTPCQPGRYNSRPGQSQCALASPGFFVTGTGNTAQSQCVNNTYSDEPGAVQCHACGANVDANAQHTDCQVTCQFNDVQHERQYNLSALSRSDSEMYGPIWDASANVYYLNMCTRQHNNHTCFSASNEPLEVYACQVTGLGIGQDLGSTFGVIPLRRDLYPGYDYGVTVHLTGGDQCHNGTTYFGRQTYIDLLCDPNAGRGEPVPRETDAESGKCFYEFEWVSLYACPLCTERDYYYYTSECDEFGMTTRTYAWNTNPKNCQGGVELPDPEPVSCANSQYCPPGEYFDAESMSCEPAPAGFYSVGNGIHITDWTELPDGFTSNNFVATKDFIRSGEEDTSLLFVHNFVREGSVSLTFSVTNYGDSTAGFSIYVDDVLQGAPVYSTHNQYITRDISLTSGYHYVRFAFEGGTFATSTAPARAVRIEEMTILGINWAASYPTPCPAGTYSPEEGATECLDCPWNTRSNQAASQCLPCDDSEYSIPGSPECHERDPCTIEDYKLVYSECVNGKQSVSYALAEPVICNSEGVSAPEPLDGDTQDCFPCRAGAYRPDGSDECERCPTGKYWDESSSQCKQATAGHAAVLRTSYFNPPESGSDLPNQFFTGCSGDCLCRNEPGCTSGWRLVDGIAESGVNMDRQLDTYLDLRMELDTPGQIMFDYQVTGDTGNGLEFYINERQIRIPYHPNTNTRDVNKATQAVVEVNEGLNLFRWNYHQQADTTGSVVLSSIMIEGAGGATENVVCQPGEYSPNSGASFCEECPAGTANPNEAATACQPCEDSSYSESGATTCISCGAETTANADRTDCQTDCIFQFNNSTYNLAPLQNIHGPFPLEDGTSGIWMNICEKRSSQSFCLDEYGDPIKTYMCGVDTRGNGVDFGNRLSVDFVEVEGYDDMAVHMSYTVVGENESNCRTSLTVVCDPDSPTTAPELLDNPADCDIHLRWVSIYGCPVCTDEDYEEQVSECISGDQTITSVRVSNCAGPAIREVEHQSCQTLYAFSMAVIIVVVILVIVLLGIIIAVVLYNRRLHNQYTALVRESEGQYEMNDIEENAVAEPESKTEESV